LISAVKRALYNIYLGLSATNNATLEREYRELRALPRYADPKHLAQSGYKIYSQGEEDGIIAEIFRRIGTVNRNFVEFGAGSGIENNSAALLLDGWSGLWIEGSGEHVNAMRAGLPSLIGSGRLKVLQSFITRDNIDGLIIGAGIVGEIDLLSVDIDGNDFEVYSAIKSIQPRVIVFEYNAKFPPPVEYCMPYDEKHIWRGGDAYGASLAFLERALRERGYYLVACSLTGNNAFFVRSDLVGDKFAGPLTAEQLYEPGRFHLNHYRTAHRPSYKALDQAATQSDI